MLNKFHKFFSSTLITFSLLFFHAPAYGESISSLIKGMLATSDNARSSSITMDSIASISSNLNTYKMTGDMQMGTSAGSTFVEAEALTIGQFKVLESDLFAATEALSHGKDADTAQVENLNILGHSYDQSAAILKTKKAMQLAASTSYATAALTALTQAGAEQDSFKDCMEPLIKAYKSCEPAREANDKVDKSLDELVEIKVADKKSTEAFSASKSKKTEATTNLKELKQKLKQESDKFNKEAEEADSQEDSQRAAGLRADAKKCSEAAEPLKTCEKLVPVLEDGETYGTLGLISLSSPKMNKSLINKFLNSLILEVTAEEQEEEKEGISDMFEMGDNNTEAFLGVSKELGSTVDMAILSPIKRVAVWEMLARMSSETAVATQAEIDQIESSAEKSRNVARKLENLRVLNNIKNNGLRNQYEKALNLFVSSAVAEGNQPNLANSIGLSKVPTRETKRPCLANIGKTNCVSLTTTMPKTTGYKLLSPSVKDLTMQIAKMGDDTNRSNGTLSPTSLANIQKIAEKKESVFNLLRKMKINKKMNFDSYEASLFKSLTSKTTNYLKKHNVSTAKYLASYGGARSKTDANTSGSAVTSAQVKIGKAAVAVVGSSEAKAEVVAEKSDKDSRFNFNGVDITKDTTESLFTLISNRYYRSFITKNPGIEK